MLDNTRNWIRDVSNNLINWLGSSFGGSFWSIWTTLVNVENWIVGAYYNAYDQYTAICDYIPGWLGDLRNWAKESGRNYILRPLTDMLLAPVRWVKDAIAPWYNSGAGQWGPVLVVCEAVRNVRDWLIVILDTVGWVADQINAVVNAGLNLVADWIGWRVGDAIMILRSEGYNPWPGIRGGNTQYWGPLTVAFQYLAQSAVWRIQAEFSLLVGSLRTWVEGLQAQLLAGLMLLNSLNGYVTVTIRGLVDGLRYDLTNQGVALARIYAFLGGAVVAPADWIWDTLRAGLLARVESWLSDQWDGV